MRTMPLLLVSLLMAAALGSVAAQDLPTVTPSQLPQQLQDQYARNRPDLGRYGHCAAGYDSRTDGLKMAFSCAIYVRLSAQGERQAVALCNERAKFLGVKARCALIAER